MDAKWSAVDKSRYTHPSYTTPIFNPVQFSRLVELSVSVLTGVAETIPFDAVAGTGFSGLPLLGALSYKMGVNVIAVRKIDEIANEMQQAMGLVRSSRYIIVDDLICSGSTIHHIMTEIAKQHDRMCDKERKRVGVFGSKDIPMFTSTECVGIFLYRGPWWKSCNFSSQEFDMGSKKIPIFSIMPFQYDQD